MHLLGHNLPDHKLLRVALTSFYGLSHSLSPRLLARLQIPTAAKVSDLTEGQITALSAFLSSPSTTPKPPPTPLASSSSSTKGKERAIASASAPSAQTQMDPLDGLRIETDLKRDLQGDIAHLRQVGAYRGRRHALGLPARGQKTRNNAQTAKKLNRVERRRYGTVAPGAGAGGTSRLGLSGSSSPFGWAARAFL